MAEDTRFRWEAKNSTYSGPVGKLETDRSFPNSSKPQTDESRAIRDEDRIPLTFANPVAKARWLEDNFALTRR